ncbi:MAG: hypothetical protein ACI4GZ_02145 [Ruminococcus sp.]
MYEFLISFKDYSDRIPTFITILVGVALAIVMFYLVVAPVHNLSMAFVAKQFGDENIKRRGYLAYAPNKSFHLIGVVSLSVLNIGFTSPIIYRRSRFYHPVIGTICVCITGVVTYFLMSVVTLIFYILLHDAALFGYQGIYDELANPSVVGYVYHSIVLMFYTLTQMCMLSMLVNLIPFTPFDMSEVLLFNLRPNWVDGIKKNQIIISFGWFVVLFLTIGKPGGLLDDIAIKILRIFADAIRSIIY